MPTVGFGGGRSPESHLAVLDPSFGFLDKVSRPSVELRWCHRRRGLLLPPTPPRAPTRPWRAGGGSPVGLPALFERAVGGPCRSGDDGGEAPEAQDPTRDHHVRRSVSGQTAPINRSERSLRCARRRMLISSQEPHFRVLDGFHQLLRSLGATRSSRPANSLGLIRRDRLRRASRDAVSQQLLRCLSACSHVGGNQWSSTPVRAPSPAGCHPPCASGGMGQARVGWRSPPHPGPGRRRSSVRQRRGLVPPPGPAQQRSFRPRLQRSNQNRGARSRQGKVVRGLDRSGGDRVG